MSSLNDGVKSLYLKNTDAFLKGLRSIVGPEHVLTGERQTLRFRKGFRFGSGKAIAVVCPGSLLEQWQIMKACVAENVIIIPQASNTGLTGGSTPFGDDYDRDIVILSTTRMKKIYLVDGGRQVICLPGSTLDQLEKELAPVGREPHSVIGSSCIGASVLGGVCNNSGGALIQRGPAYTELALYAQVGADGQVSLVNHLGVNLGDTPEVILQRLDAGQFETSDVQTDVGVGHDPNYEQHVRGINEPTPARFNADPDRLFEASGSAGKVMVFAVRLDTFPITKESVVFYIGTNHASELTEVRRHMLANFKELPISAEYLHRDAYDVAEKYGKDTFLIITKFGTEKLPKLFALKSKADEFFERIPGLPKNLPDRVMQMASQLFPNHLPERMRNYREKYEHHLVMKVSKNAAEESRQYLQSFFNKATGDFFECSADEGKKAFLHRFVMAGAANRYRAVNPDTVEDILALDIALPRNTVDWLEQLPAEIDQAIEIKLYYGHFFCYVFHQDYIVKKGNDCLALEHKMWATLDARGAEYPAEHNVGHLYYAKEPLANHYQKLDPCNCLNPGIGHTSKKQHYL
ncbi:D-lactate dehydrogenase [Pseudomonas kermanshahensis]|uniref:D-lactate dehydrogenase n=1 Tax=Pseudomonas kermanshahensis TaxID=2745482 RepID=UPI0023DB0844|nr:D-lactate dehydrogenase [Pseudomonas kermanshahensis]WEL57537.1 D-lactate dehydrogenase [Pseudomonas kermanshahensis]